MHVVFMSLNLFRHTRKLKKTHDLVVAECGCVNKHVGDVVNLEQIHDLIT